MQQKLGIIAYTHKLVTFYNGKFAPCINLSTLSTLSMPSESQQTRHNVSDFQLRYTFQIHIIVLFSMQGSAQL